MSLWWSVTCSARLVRIFPFACGNFAAPMKPAVHYVHAGLHVSSCRGLLWSSSTLSFQVPFLLHCAPETSWEISRAIWNVGIFLLPPAIAMHHQCLQFYQVLPGSMSSVCGAQHCSDCFWKGHFQVKVLKASRGFLKKQGAPKMLRVGMQTQNIVPHDIWLCSHLFPCSTTYYFGRPK